MNPKSNYKPTINFNNINGSDKIENLNEIDYLKNKIMKKKEKSKTNNNYLNYTNPHQISNSSSQPKQNGFNEISNL